MFEIYIIYKAGLVFCAKACKAVTLFKNLTADLKTISFYPQYNSFWINANINKNKSKN